MICVHMSDTIPKLNQIYNKSTNTNLNSLAVFFFDFRSSVMSSIYEKENIYTSQSELCFK